MDELRWNTTVRIRIEKERLVPFGADTENTPDVRGHRYPQILDRYPQAYPHIDGNG